MCVLSVGRNCIRRRFAEDWTAPRQLWVHVIQVGWDQLPLSGNAHTDVSWWSLRTAGVRRDGRRVKPLQAVPRLPVSKLTMTSGLQGLLGPKQLISAASLKSTCIKSALEKLEKKKTRKPLHIESSQRLRPTFGPYSVFAGKRGKKTCISMDTYGTSLQSRRK